MPKPQAAVIGAGPMGVWVAQHLAKQGYIVKVYDRNRERLRNLPRNLYRSESLDDSVRNASLVCLAVGTKNSAELASEIVQNYNGKVVIDISSVKTPVFEQLKTLDVKDNLIVLTHPLFGPGTKKLEDKTVFIVPFRNRFREYRVCKKLFPSCKIIAVSSASHDMLMAIAMSLPRVLLLSLFDTWRRNRVERLTVSQRAIWLAASTTLTENTSLTSEVVAENPYTAEAIKQFEEAVEWIMKDPAKNVEMLHKRFKKRSQETEYFQIYRLLEKLSSKR
ncbi:MAG: prephenate dehydrogenase/arogenate dehydrogenase family protein [Candidatus Caldarchaeum sp.]|nr:prephenate dehydrogenase/arogenate dehydrogenase family protein [Candidatus Caldarchaeum sp.]